jgi:hypothetical protein
MQQSKNVFRSLSMDVNEALTQNVKMLYNKNFRILTRAKDNWVLTNVKGNELAGNLTNNFIPVCVEVYDGIAYIISAEIIAGAPTGVGEIGTYPSPDYGNSEQITSHYRPLNNLFNPSTGSFGHMRSSSFNFTLESAFSMELNEDYDGTINIVFNDGVNPMRIINSRFVRKGESQYEIIDRSGVKDTNLYYEKDFETIINLVSRAARIMKVDLLGIRSGGLLQVGNYRYYFKLETEDGNKTDIAGESGLVSIFHGDSPGTVRGGYVENNIATNKMASFRLQNVDDSYPYVKVYFVYSSGENEPIEKAYVIDQRYQVENNIVNFNHIGSEQLIETDISVLNLQSQSIDKVGTIASGGGYLLAGDITEKVTDYNILIDFVKKITVSHTDKKIHTYGITDNGGDLSVKNNQDAEVVGTDGFNNGYANPRNIYAKAPYMSGESYPFGARIILRDKTFTLTFPVMGIDNVTGAAVYPTPAFLAALADTLSNEHLGFRESDGANLKGVYRFPNKQRIFDGQYLEVMGVKFKIPDIPSEVKNMAIGIQFMRGERNADRIGQGVFFNTMPIPVDEYTAARTGTTRNWRLYDYLRDGERYTETTAKWIPTYDFGLESFGVWEMGNNGIERSNKTADNGIVPIKFSTSGGRGINRNKMFAFVSPEIQTISSKVIAAFNNRNVSMKMKGMVISRLDAPSVCYNENLTYSLIRQKGTTPLNGSHESKTSFVVGGDHGPNIDRYAGGCYFQAHTGVGEFTMYNLKFNNYIGLKLDTGNINIGVNSMDLRAGEVNYNKNGTDNNASVFADIYPESGQRNTAQLKTVFSNISAITYFPISERLYWDESEEGSINDLSLEAKLNGSREIELFGGDNFVGPHYRRLYVNAYGTYGQQNFSEFQGASNIGETMMYFAESSVNSALRGEHYFDLSEYRERSFYPYEAGKKPFSQGNRFGSGNPWREYRLLETDNYNHGHRQLLFGNYSIAFPVGSPFIATKRRARIMHSRKFTSNSFNNEFRSWEGLNYVDYDNSLGKIIRLGMIGDQVLIVQEGGISFIRLEERIVAGNDSAGPVYFESAGVLPPKATFISGMGSKWPESIIYTDMGVYGFDSESLYIWMYDMRTQTPISRFSVDSYLQKVLTGIDLKKYTVTGAYNVIASRDAYNEEILFSFLKETGSFTLGFSEITKEISSFYSFVPFKSFSKSREYFTIRRNGSVWKHDSDNVPRGNFYGLQENYQVSFVVNEQVDFEKIFALMQIHSNHVFPNKITFRVPGAKSVENIIHQGPIYMVNAKYIGNKICISIPKIKEINNMDGTEYYAMEIANRESIMTVGSRIKGNYMVVDLEYNNPDLIVIKSVVTEFNFV